MPTPEQLIAGAAEVAPPIGMMLSPDDVRKLSSYVGRNLFGPEDLLKGVSSLCSFRMDGVVITLDSNLLSRLKSRFPRRTQEEYVRDLKAEIIRQLRTFAGI